ncbi:MAG: alpha/beta hydrolase [Gammaproteobacteria bacterium]
MLIITDENPLQIEIRPKRRLHIFHHNANSRKTLFLLHGAGGRMLQWREQIAFFAKDYNIVALDNLGHGKSDRPKNATNKTLYSFAEISQDHQAIFDRYATEENIVIGHSYGGAFASYLALKNPDKINKLILIAPTSFTPKVPAWVFRLPVFIMEIFRTLLNKQFAHLAFHPQTDQQLVTSEMAEARKNSLHVMKELVLNMAYLPKIDPTQIKQPTLVLFSYSDNLVPAQQSIEFYRDLPNVEFKEIALAKHVLMLEQPQQMNHIIQTFLEK